LVMADAILKMATAEKENDDKKFALMKEQQEKSFALQKEQQEEKLAFQKRQEAKQSEAFDLEQ
jgi:hypothetical protein